MRIRVQQHSYLHRKLEKLSSIDDNDLTSHEAILASHVIDLHSQELREPRSNSKCEQSNSGNHWIFILEAKRLIDDTPLEEKHEISPKRGEVHLHCQSALYFIFDWLAITCPTTNTLIPLLNFQQPNS